MRVSCRGRLSGLERMRFLRGAVVALIGAILAGCPASSPPPAPATQKVVIRGSNTIGEELAPQLIAEFKKANPAVTFDLETKATGYGLAAVRSGLCDIAGASRIPIREELEENQAKGVELNEYIIGAYSVAVVVNQGNPLADLTRSQVRDIFTGAVKNWKEVGGPDAPIHLYGRDPISGTHLGFRELAMEDKSYGSGLNLFTNYAGIAQAVAADPAGIGYTSFNLANGTGVKALSIGGAPPTDAAVNSGKYPYARVLRFYTNKAAESAPTVAFLQFVLSPPGQKVLAQAGFVPRP
jgi:phosphate transport system substrate-binding protein